MEGARHPNDLSNIPDDLLSSLLNEKHAGCALLYISVKFHCFALIYDVP